MLKALVVTNRRFIHDNGDVFTEGPIGAETGERYLKWFDAVTVLGRPSNSPCFNKSKLNKLTDNGVLYVESRHSSKPIDFVFRRHAIKNELLRLFESSNCVIARLGGLGTLAAELALQVDKPLALDVGGCILDDYLNHGSPMAKIVAPFAFAKQKKIINMSRWISYVTQDFLQSRYPHNSNANTLACSNVDIPPPSTETYVYRLNKIRSRRGRFIFGSVGSLHGKFKGIQHAFSALSKIKFELPDFQYRILGGGNPQPWAELAAYHGLSDHVCFDGLLPAGDAVFEWLDNIDLLLHPSMREGLPRAVIEAMSRGIPVLASNVAGTPELLPSECLHRPGDIDTLCVQIVNSMDSDWLLKQAHSNWERAHSYSRPVIEKKRDVFWTQFADYVRLQLR